LVRQPVQPLSMFPSPDWQCPHGVAALLRVSWRKVARSDRRRPAARGTLSCSEWAPEEATAHLGLLLGIGEEPTKTHVGWPALVSGCRVCGGTFA
jgi:hypothetical protein